MNFFQKQELKLLWPFYLDALLSPMLFFAPAFMILFFRDLNFSMFQIALIMAAYSLSTILFEIPTGAVADLYGRKFSVLLSTILSSISLLSLFFFRDFYLILFSFAFLGFASTFASGANEAWVTDLIKSKDSKLLHGFFVKKQSLGSFGLIISGFLGALFVKNFGMSIIWLVAFFSCLVSFFILMFGKEIFTRKNVKLKGSIKQVSNQAMISLKYCKNHHVLYYFLIASMILVFASDFNGNLSWTPFLQELGLQEYAFGYMLSAMAFIGVIAPLITSRFYKKNREKSFILNAIIIWVVFALLVIFVKELTFAFVILLGTMFFHLSRTPVERVYFQRFIPSKLRATVGSVESVLLSVIDIIALPIAGLLIDKLGSQYTIFLSGLVAIPAIIIYAKIKENKKSDYLSSIQTRA